MLCQDILRLCVDHLLLLLGALPGHLPPHLPVHHGRHRQDNQAGEISRLKEENSDEIGIVFALLSIVVEVLLMKRPTPDPGTLSDRANKSVLCVNTRRHSNVITTSPHRFVWTISKYFMKMMVFSLVVVQLRLRRNSSFLCI